MIETIINILITLISGGFIIFLIEIENRKDREYDKYFYFMVFENSKIEGSLLIDEFIDTIKELWYSNFAIFVNLFKSFTLLLNILGYNFKPQI